MSLILNIDTSTVVASVSVSEKGNILSVRTNHIQNDHATFLHGAILSVIKENNSHVNNLTGIGVTNGPGSYTGIRVGLSSAKGLCMALNIPLIVVNTLETIAADMIMNYGKKENDVLFCPMIDARRMEVYTGVYDSEMNEVLRPQAKILNEESFKEISDKKKILIAGSGSDKFISVVKLRNFDFMQSVNIPVAMAMLTYNSYLRKSFADLTYSEPFYLKEFFNG